MDSMAICRFHADGQEWLSTEQYYQACKFADPAQRERIRQITPGRNLGPRISASTHGREVCILGQSRDHALADPFHGLETMYVATRAKFEQNAELRKELLCSRTPMRPGTLSADGNEDWMRWNTLLLERIREELRPDEERDEVRLVELRRSFAESGETFDEARVAARFEALGEQPPPPQAASLKLSSQPPPPQAASLQLSSPPVSARTASTRASPRPNEITAVEFDSTSEVADDSEEKRRAEDMQHIETSRASPRPVEITAVEFDSTSEVADDSEEKRRAEDMQHIETSRASPRPVEITAVEFDSTSEVADDSEEKSRAEDMQHIETSKTGEEKEKETKTAGGPDALLGFLLFALLLL